MDASVKYSVSLSSCNVKKTSLHIYLNWTAHRKLLERDKDSYRSNITHDRVLLY